MAHSDDERKALGARLASARNLTGLTIQQAADALTKRGYPISKQGIGHWESGRNVPDAIWLRRLAKLYESTLDALVWDDAVSMEAIKVAVEYDSLTEPKRRTWNYLWLGFISGAAPGGDALPLSPDSDNPANRESATDEQGTNAGYLDLSQHRAGNLNYSGDVESGYPATDDTKRTEPHSGSTADRRGTRPKGSRGT